MTNEIIITNDDLITELISNMPVEASYQRLSLPRLGMFSQDIEEGKGKSKVVTTEAGTYYIEEVTDEIDENGKKVYTTTEIGGRIEATIFYYRKKLTYFDNDLKEFTSSPVFDTEDETVILFKNKKEVYKGTPAELKKKYEYIDPRDNKKKSELKDVSVLYLYFNDTIYQMEVKGSSRWAFKDYSRGCLLPTVLTHMSSEYKENGSIKWNQIVFKTIKKLEIEELTKVVNSQKLVKEAVQSEKDYYNKVNINSSENTGGGADDWSPTVVVEAITKDNF